MELTFIGLGRMGSAMSAQLATNGFTVHGFDEDSEARKQAALQGVPVYDSLQDAISHNTSNPKIIWLMVPAKYVENVLETIAPQLTKDDIVIDGGNSFYKDSLTRHQSLSENGIHFIDCGVSGGIVGARNGASLMVGGDKAVVKTVEPLFTALATADGYARVGGGGAGHFVKMVHNGIEYGMMSAIAEGMSVIESRQADFSIDINEVLKPYEHGSVITSSLMSWLAEAYRTPGYLEAIAGTVPTGETEFEMEHLVETTFFPTLKTALTVRKHTRTEPSRVGTLLSAMRNQFGGHKIVGKDGIS